MTDGKWRGQVYRHLLTPSGIVLVRRDGRPLIDNWARWHHHDKSLGSKEPGTWGWSELTLLEARDETRLCCAVISLREFGSSRLAPDAAIWSAHDPRRKKEFFTSFRKEYERQYALALCEQK